jgi:hypothetical protein
MAALIGIENPRLAMLCQRLLQRLDAVIDTRWLNQSTTAARYWKNFDQGHIGLAKCANVSSSASGFSALSKRAFLAVRPDSAGICTLAPKSSRTI